MYKLLLLLFSCVCMTSCWPFLFPNIGESFPDTDYEVYWDIRNYTDNDVIIKAGKTQYTIVSKQKRSILCLAYRIKDGTHEFDDIERFFRDISTRQQEDTSRMIIAMRLALPQTDTALFPKRVWRYSQRQDAGKQFFGLGSWIQGKNKNGRDFTYTFELYPEDFGLDERVVARQ